MNGVSSFLIMRAFRMLQEAVEPLVASDLSLSGNGYPGCREAFGVLIKLGIAERCIVTYPGNHKYASREVKAYKLINPREGWSHIRLRNSSK